MFHSRHQPCHAKLVQRSVPTNLDAVKEGRSSSYHKVGMFVGSIIAYRGIRTGRHHRRSIQSMSARGGEEASEPFSLHPKDQWIASLNLEEFGREVQELGRQLEAEQGEADIQHLHKIVMWSDACAVIGLGTMWLAPNPLSIIALSLWTFSRWTMIGHHSCHGGYNRTDKTGRYSSRGFAVGSLWQRITDWFDWMLPEAWGVEHNQLHHFRLGEVEDPDLMERNVEIWEAGSRYPLTFLSMAIWKWAYYAPNTYKELKLAKMRQEGRPLPDGFDPQAGLTLGDILEQERKGTALFSVTEFLTNVIGPYLLLHFFVLPLPLALLSPGFYLNAVANLFLAELLTNIHAFAVIATNHCGEDLYRFEQGCKPKSPTFFLRAIVSSTNFSTGGDVNDFFHGWLNYQIEHHAWPNLSMLSYQKAQPKLKAICEKHGVPYVQENVFMRLKKTVDIMVQNTKMRRYPQHLERIEDVMVWNSDKASVAV